MEECVSKSEVGIVATEQQIPSIVPIDWVRRRYGLTSDVTIEVCRALVAEAEVAPVWNCAVVKIKEWIEIVELHRGAGEAKASILEVHRNLRCNTEQDALRAR